MDLEPEIVYRPRDASQDDEQFGLIMWWIILWIQVIAVRKRQSAMEELAS